jgi:hypothetical protein
MVYFEDGGNMFLQNTDTHLQEYREDPENEHSIFAQNLGI